MAFPLYLETYSVGGRVYRRNPYAGNVGSSSNPNNYGDTEDLYGDEDAEDGPACTIDLHTPRGGREEDMNTENEGDTPSASVCPPPGLAPPPGFEMKLQGNSEVHQTVDKKARNGRGKLGRETEEGNENVVFSLCEEDSRVEKGGNKWRARVEVPSIFHSRLIGHRGTVLREMETSTQCRVRVPDRKEKKETVEVTSTRSLECVQRCLDRIELILIKAKEGSRPTHFVCLPMIFEDVVESYKQFKEMVVATDFISPSCKDERLFMSHKKLHLTLAVMRLFTEGEKQTARDALQRARERVRSLTGGSALSADVEGLQIMNDDPSRVDVLYAGVQGQHVQQAANIVVECLAEAGVCEKAKGSEDVKLHMTLMNSRYLAEEQSAKRTAFDAKSLVEEMGGFYFGSVNIDKICLCAMSTEGKDGFYETFETVSLS